MFTFSAKSLERLSTVNPRLQGVARRALTISKIDFGIPSGGGYRTVEEQQELYNNGKSQLDGINKKSKHQTRNALDVYAYVDGEASWDVNHLTHIAAAFLQAASELGVKLTWGGFWRSFVDGPHFQLEDEDEVF